MWGIRATRIVLDDQLKEGTLLIEGSSIHSFSTQPPDDLEILDVGDAVVMAGGVDPHVHINEPGRTAWEGFTTATRAALLGGLTTLVDMPLNSSPVTTTPEALARKLESLQGKLHLDVGFWAGVIPGHNDQLPALLKAGALGAKAFMCHSGIDEFPASDPQTLREALHVLKEYDAPLLAHAEVPSPVSLPDLPPSSYQRYLQSRPPKWECDAIELLISLCRETGARVHVVHLAAADALPMLTQAREEGLPLTVETCPHYLCIHAEEIPDGDVLYKCAPPIRDAQNQQALWQALEEGIIDFVATDHSPCPPEDKALDAGDFEKAWGGISSLDLSLSLLWTGARERALPIPRIARWLSQNPSKLPRLTQKGTLEPGTDADIVIWDPDAHFTVSEEHLATRHKLTPYRGRTLYGRVLSSYVRGQRVYHEGAFLEPPAGKALLSQP